MKALARIKKYYWSIMLISTLSGVGLLSCNPFAPDIDPEGLAGVNVLGDPTSVDGFFQLFKNAYELRDTALYGRLFAQDFEFAYFDFEQNQEIRWDRATELNISFNLFQSVQQISLDWNFYIQLDTTQTAATIVRNFSLTIEQDEENIFVGTGRARMNLRRVTPGSPWKAFFWFDESDF